ncbi:MAG: S1C family serine protease [Bacilli bacterium]|nr:S1C family serine protease [Bacilli bacterium]
MKKSELSIVLIITILISFIFGSIFSYLILFKDNSNSNDSSVRTSTSITLKEDMSIDKGIEKIYDAVVVIEGYSKKQKISTGTGFIYKKSDNNYFVMTNHHVVSECDDIKIILSDKTELDTTLMGSEAYSDIAVLKVKSDKIKQVANIGKSDTLQVGDTLFAVGSPESVDYAGTVTKGVLSGKDRLVEVALTNNKSSDYFMKVLQTDAAINPGNSGGPLCNINGDVIGITNMKLVDSTVEGMGFAIPIEDALNYALVFEKGEKLKRPYVGISMVDINDGYFLWENNITIPTNVKSGVVVVEVGKDSPAGDAGLKKGDVIIQLGANKVSSVAEFRYELYKSKVGDKIKVKFIRDKKNKEVEIKLSEKPNEEEKK